jgi:hypothetical protein
MPNFFNLTDEMQNYFNSLPKTIQENLIQSGAKVNSLSEMKNIVNTLTQKDNSNEEKQF